MIFFSSNMFLNGLYPLKIVITLKHKKTHDTYDHVGDDEEREARNIYEYDDLIDDASSKLYFMIDHPWNYDLFVLWMNTGWIRFFAH